MLLLGIDIGTSSIKVSVVDAQTQVCLASAQHPEEESGILAPNAGWAEQAPAMWWEHAKVAILKAHATGRYNPKDIGAIGIAYQMHGLVVVDKEQKALRNAIIWCDSRAVEIGNRAFKAIGEERSLTRLLNSPGNFTASKLAWVKENEPAVYGNIDKIMLPGDYVGMRLTGEVTTSVSALSEGVFWDFQENELSSDVLGYFQFDRELIPAIHPVFSEHGRVQQHIADELGLQAGIPVTYKSGDQPNNALSLNVLQPGEVAATAGTSGVIYGVSDKLLYDPESRVNTFAHVNYSDSRKRLGMLLCINGTGSLNRWMKQVAGSGISYADMNEMAAAIPVGSEGLRVIPFGNGAERMLHNKIVGTHFHHIDLNLHSKAHLFRAAQEGIAFAFRYGLDILRENGMNPGIIRAGQANLFQSNLFTEAFVNATHVPVELYLSDGSIGAALGAGIGVKAFASEKEAFANSKRLRIVEPQAIDQYEPVYQEWKALLEKHLNEA
ncbi:carbohydrate kinase [Pontibacter sp. JH31]|uniref:Carbohydrate kinase n=1 Tax=Pontibacter aquaedesilientis TaxID=2766980 RepID=A0ABR7XFE2_9BACT|nr:FGGY family carbohydrate kinase [Pontibacter aquaedesilientis]MBD1396631.1 carbohydrate kinase [Pontibacter aquaedesilientis]